MSRSSETVSALPGKVDRSRLSMAAASLAGEEGNRTATVSMRSITTVRRSRSTVRPRRSSIPTGVTTLQREPESGTRLDFAKIFSVVYLRFDNRPAGRPLRENSRGQPASDHSPRLVWRRAGHAAAPREKLLPEAELRLRARTLNEHIDSVSLYAGEEGEKQHLITELKDVLRIMRQIVGTHHTAYVSQRVTAGPQSLPPF